MNLRDFVFELCLLALAATAHADAPAGAGCTIVFGQGRNEAAGDAPSNRVWDDVNIDFNAEVAGRLQAAGTTVVALVLRVNATDLRSNARQLLERAAAEHCTELVETTIFADYAAHTLVARLRRYPIVSEPGATPAAPLLRIGKPSWVGERDFELTRSTLDHVQPAALADAMAAELLAAAPAR